MKVTLSSQDTKELDIPLEYELDMQNASVSNTYIFSEPAARPTTKDIKDEHDSNLRRRIGGLDRSRKGLGGQRITGKIVHDCIVKPIDNAHYRSLLRNRVRTADVPERRVQVVDDLNHNLIQAGTMGGRIQQGGLKSFIGTKKNKVRDVQARLPLDVLIDEISKCFQQYEYWSLKAFRAHLKQPESYLKETLESIAMLHKRGPMAGKWQLKAETRNAIKGYAGLPSQSSSADDVKIKSEHEGQAAPDEDIEDSDEDIEMEDKL